MHKEQTIKKYRTSLIIFFSGLVLTIIGLQFPPVRHLFFSIEQTGYLGSFLAGILYSSGFTSSSAVVIFAQMPDRFNPLLIAIVAGIGSVFYDATLFALFRSQGKKRIIEVMRDKIRHTSRRNRRIMVIIGLLIHISPLPDELAAGVLSLSQMKMKHFIALSFLLNAMGVLIIVLISR